MSVVRDKKRHRQRHKNSSLKIFLNRHQHIIDLLSATLVIGLCLIVLLPKVHDSFVASGNNHTHLTTDQDPLSTAPRSSEIEAQPDDSFKIATISEILVASVNNNTLAVSPTSDLLPIVDPAQDEHHHHHHGFPAGEFLICCGFFVFYCAGFSLDKGAQDRRESRRLSLGQSSREHRPCCSSTRCPPIQLVPTEQQQQQQQQQQQADNCRELDPEGAKLILATCELMNTTKNLIDSCESYADQLTGQPSAQRAARKLASWKSLLTNLNSSLLNEKGQSRLQDDNLRAKMNAIKDQQHQQRQQSAARTSTTGTTASVFQGQQQQQEEEAEDNFNDNEQLDLPCEPLPNGKRRMNRTTSQAHKIIFCPMRHSDESILASGHIGTPPADDVEICGAIRRRRQEGDQNGRAEGKSGDNERANVSCMVAGDGFGNDVVANTTTSEPPHVGLGAVVDEMAKRTHEDCSQELEKQIAKIELETATSDDDDDDDDDDDEKHNRARESLSMACPILGQNSSRASVASNNTRTNDERSSRSTDSMRGSQATNSTTGTQLEQQPPADSSSTTRSANNSSANWSSSSSNSANRPKQSSFCLVGGEQKQQQQQQQQQQAKTAAGELPFSSEHNENLYRVSGDSSGPGQSGVNELSEARPSSIKISVEAAEADEEEEEEETKLEKEDQEEASLARQEPLFVTKSKKRFKLIWTSNGDVGQEEDSAEPVRCQQSQQTLLSTLLARVGASSSNHGNCSNDGGESYRIANNNNDSANASTIIGGINPNTDAAISRTAACLTGGRGSGESGAEFRTVALLHKGEISVENLLHSIERRRDKTYPDGRVSSAGDNDDEDGGGGGDLIEFIRVIILINKLILALASSSIKEASRSGPPSETTFCKTTLVN